MDDDIELEIGGAGQEFGAIQEPDQDMEEGELSDSEDLRHRMLGGRKKNIHDRLGPRINFGADMGQKLLPVSSFVRITMNPSKSV